MSAEGKKKRGESGKKNAESSPFRMNGRPADWEARSRGCFQTRGAASSGSVTMRGLLGGMIAERMGYAMPGMPGIEYTLEHAASRVTHPALTF